MLLRLISRRHEKRIKAFDKTVGDALKFAHDGDVEAVLRLLSEASRLSDQYDLPFWRNESDFIRNIAHKNGLEAALNHARYWAGDGDVSTTMRYLGDAKRYAKEVNTKIDEQVEMVMKEAYKKGAEERLYWASHNLNGDHPIPFNALQDIKRARLYASRAGLDTNERAKINERAKQLRIEAAAYGVQVYLNLAREDAEKGDLAGAQTSFRRAKRFGQMAGLDTSQQIKEIEPLAYAGRARLDLEMALQLKQDGYEIKARIWEEMARLNNLKALDILKTF